MNGLGKLEIPKKKYPCGMDKEDNIICVGDMVKYFSPNGIIECTVRYGNYKALGIERKGTYIESNMFPHDCYLCNKDKILKIETNDIK